MKLVKIYVRIDYCNSLINGLPDYYLNRLQKNNEQCWVYFVLDFLNFIIALMYSWTFIGFLNVIKVLIITYQIYYKTAPQHLCDLNVPYILMFKN